MINDVLLNQKITDIPGPILILGGSGFVGANLFRLTQQFRTDVFTTASKLPAWRLDDVDNSLVIKVDLTSEYEVSNLLDAVKPMTVLDCVTYGGYSFEKDYEKIYQTNLVTKVFLINELIKRNIYCYIHAGSSSEYGINSSAPLEDVMTTPNSHYAVTKCAIAQRLYYAGKFESFRCANLRLYSVYGPLEDSSRLIPQLIKSGVGGKFPPFVNPEISRDFVYVDDVCRAFVDAVVNLSVENYGASFNIGTGTETTIRSLALLAKDVYNINEEPQFATMEQRAWDTQSWFANPLKAERLIGWRAQTTLSDGLSKTTTWYCSLADHDKYFQVSKQNQRSHEYSISAVVACYKDNQAIPIMVERLENIFNKCQIDYEIILVNDCSPDDSEEVIQQISLKNSRVIGITHSRNFGSQAAFMSGMGISTKNACVLLDGDLQDPPELIEQFLAQWKNGYDVIYGVRVKRDAPLMMQIAYKAFYRLFNKFSFIPMPRDAGDFSLIDRKVVQWLLECKERDLFLRGLRAYVGFKQTGVPYVRPERMFGVSTNNLFKNIMWAKKGILSFSRTPIDMLTTAGFSLVILTIILAIAQILLRALLPDLAPKGLTTVILLIMFFGSFTILSISIVGEYIAKIFEETKQRPGFIRRHIIKNGKKISTEHILNTNRK
jgi:nucleoside-diphosphate-sugar epimerase/glycosyltransferase involved in cell wall biosynthesis